jgi:hypothetical protein
MPRRLSLAIVFGLTLVFAAAAPADTPILVVREVPGDGLVMGRVDLTGVLPSFQVASLLPQGLRATDAAGQAVPFQFVPDADFDAKSRATGTVVCKLAPGGPAELRLTVAEGLRQPAWDGTVSTSEFTAAHDPKRQGGLPWKFTFAKSGKVLEGFRWNNRVHHRESSSWSLCDDPQATVERASAGPLCHVVRARAHFVQRGKRPPSEPSAVYDWYYFIESGRVYVQATFQQRQPAVWHELHPLEFNYVETALPRWAGGNPPVSGEFRDTKKTQPCSSWGVIHDGRHGLGMFQAGQALFYDCRGASYLQAHGDSVWREWGDTRQSYSMWLWIGAAEDPAKAVQAVAHSNPFAARVTVSLKGLRERIDAAARELAAAAPAARQPLWWRVAGAERLESQGRVAEALEVVAGRQPANWTTLTAGDLGAIIERNGGGMQLVTLFDAGVRQSLSATPAQPLFRLVLRNAENREEVRLTSASGWQTTAVTDSHDAGWALQWRRPSDQRLGDLEVVVRAATDPAAHRIRWRLEAHGQAAPWSLWRVTAPAVAIADLGPAGEVFFPKACGEVQRGVWHRPFRFTGTYPGGWTTMQYLAAYDAARGTGLYVAAHDPWGGTKDVQAESRSADHAVVLAFDHPVPDMGQAGNRFALAGEGVWQLLRGDWFDAAVIYREWVRREAKWFPKLGPDGRADTPSWMRDLSVWALGGGAPGECVGTVKGFAQALGPAVGFHWYNWHQIPFDNDYPHYFPTKPGFADGVRELQAAGVFPMPYINGRLWDTRDKGTEDFEFTKVAKPAVSKNERGEPYIESYGSKETDGSSVRLGVMCPTTALWQQKMRDTVLRLMNECGVSGVYIDQIAAAAPTLCFDKSHGHPLGGGHWWTEGYWKLLEGIRQSLPPGRMLTTECNGEPYIRWFDGYLTWHWQYDGQVPAFPAVYGGAIQMFGRSYGGGDTRHLALRMRAGQQLVFGEQIGWINTAMALEKENADCFRNVVHLRRQLQRYFHAGEMARPPRLTGSIPAVRADWQWGGVAWVTTDAVLTGAWHQPAAKRLVLIFANVGDQPVAARLRYDMRQYGFPDEPLQLVKVTAAGYGEATASGAVVERELTFPPRTAWAWEVRPSSR